MCTVDTSIGHLREFCFIQLYDFSDFCSPQLILRKNSVNTSVVPETAENNHQNNNCKTVLVEMKDINKAGWRNFGIGCLP